MYDEGICLHGYSPEQMGKAQVRGFYEGIFSAFDTPKLSFEEVLWKRSSWRGAPAPSQHGHCRQHGPQNDPLRGSRRPVLL